MHATSRRDGCVCGGGGASPEPAGGEPAADPRQGLLALERLALHAGRWQGHARRGGCIIDAWAIYTQRGGRNREVSTDLAARRWAPKVTSYSATPSWVVVHPWPPRQARSLSAILSTTRFACGSSSTTVWVATRTMSCDRLQGPVEGRLHKRCLFGARRGHCWAFILLPLPSL